MISANSFNSTARNKIQDTIIPFCGPKVAKFKSTEPKEEYRFTRA